MWYAALFSSFAAPGPVAEAGDPVAPSVSPEANAAEYLRLTEELDKLASRNAWAGVERTYQALMSTGHPPSFQDHVTGAHAARAIGDMGNVRARLMRAIEIQETREILDWLWEIETSYAKVFLACDPGKHQAVFGAEKMPFHPDQRRAVTFTVEQVRAHCLFDGYLPGGDYTFGGFDMQVEPRIQSVRMDLRNMELPKGKKRKKVKDDG